MLTALAGVVAASSKTGFVADSPYSVRQLSRSTTKRYTDKSKLPLFYRLLLIHFGVVTLIGFGLFGLSFVGLAVGAVWAVFISLPATYFYWYLVVVKVKDKDESGPP